MLVSQLSADRFDERQLGDVVDRAEGNAFFVEELVNAAAEPGGAVPNDLADLLLVRLDRLDEAARQVVRTASVGGRRVSHVLLEAVVDLGANELETALRSAVDQNVLTADRGGYAFRHALLGEAVHDDLLPGERIRLHTRYVRALQDDPAAGPAAGLARHARLAHDWPTAFSASIEAAREANAVGAPASAAGHYLRALEIRATESDLSVDGPGPVDLVISAGEALMLAGDPERAEAVLREQYTAMGPGSSVTDQARLLVSLARAGSFLDGEQESLELSAKAVWLVPEGLSVVRTEIMVNHAKVLGAWGRVFEAEQAGLEALAMAEQLQRNDLASDAATTLSALLGSGSTEQMRESLRASVERAASAGALEAELRGRYLLGRSFQDQGQYSEAVGWFESAVELAADRHSRWAPYAFVAYWQLCWIRYLQGDWEQALAMTVVDDQPPLTGAVLTALRCTIGSARGDDIGRELAGLRSFWTRDVAVAIHSAPLEMILAGRRGQPESIMDRYAEVVADLTPVWQEWFDARLRLAAVAIGAIAEALPGCSSQQRLALRNPIERLHADGLEVLARRSSLARQRWGPEGRAWETRLHAETLRARWLVGSDDAPGAEELITAWKMCEEAFARLGHVHELAVVRTALVGVLQAAGGDQPQVRELIAAARRTAVALGAKPLLERLGSHRDAGPGPVELTPREGEVLRQVAEGHSNGEIGKRLFIATKTVSVHVSNLMAKLGASSRTEAVAMARRRGLI
ncbi:regulatory LuxR family protein [Naumannella halotolerans]|uniref:Regulatory LuxR family protein n=1 Tax=Naumannella halotolerans TaxID=993414 RepID=A0A4R7IZB5_9ACTN|nr:regulatory LuxR family protein [Naumannella halotolerans]